MLRAVTALLLVGCGGARAPATPLPKRTPYLMLFQLGKSWTLPSQAGPVSCKVADSKQVGDSTVSRLDCGALLVSGTWVATPAGLYHPYLPVDDPDELALLGDDDLLIAAIPKEREHSRIAEGVEESVEAFGLAGSWCVRQTTQAPQGDRRTYALCFDGTNITGGSEDVVSSGERIQLQFGAAPPAHDDD